MFPAVSDLKRHFPEAEIHWLVEPAFAELAGWHSAVDKVIEVPLRSHKKCWWKIPSLLGELKRKLDAEKYDLVIDAQGLLKSALLSRLAGNEVYGFDSACAREPIAARFYKKTAKLDSGIHVIEKNRRLIAQLFGADISSVADFGLDAFRKRQSELPQHLKFSEKPCVVLLHGTTWSSKHWPESSWHELVRLLMQNGMRCLLPWGNEEERQRAIRLAVKGAEVLPRLTLGELANVLIIANAFVSVETGIGHLASVLDVPGIMLHGPTDPDYSGILNKSCQHLVSGLECSPCFKRDCPKLQSASGIPPCQQALTPEAVFARCASLIAHAEDARARIAPV
jgi:heptosyltransferase-1